MRVFLAVIAAGVLGSAAGSADDAVSMVQRGVDAPPLQAGDASDEAQDVAVIEEGGNPLVQVKLSPTAAAELRRLTEENAPHAVGGFRRISVVDNHDRATQVVVPAHLRMALFMKMAADRLGLEARMLRFMRDGVTLDYTANSISQDLYDLDIVNVHRFDEEESWSVDEEEEKY